MKFFVYFHFQKYQQISMFIILFLYFIPPSFAQQYYPMPSCSSTQFDGSQCTSTPCSDTRCLTCSPLSVSDCLLCASPYSLSRSQGKGSCLSECSNTQIRTVHYNITANPGNQEDSCLTGQNCLDGNCLSCLEGNADYCLICAKGTYPRYIKGGNSVKCVNCSRAMINCQECAWNTYCSRCKAGNSDDVAGYLVNDDGSYCKNCDSEVSSCSQCDGMGKCLSCTSGFYLFDDGKKGSCISCLSYCDVCSDADSCQKCSNRYFLEDSSTCTSCNFYLSNCVSCSNKTMCEECELDFFLSNVTNQCSPCSAISNALDCNGTHSTQCQANFTLDLSQKSCSPCSAIDHCSLCDGLTCANCSEGYFLSPDKRTCENCQTIANCELCNGTSCARCQVGFFLTVVNESYQCISCDTIGNSSSCDGLSLVRCKDDFLLQDNTTCSSCDSFSNCAKCNGVECVLCKKGYFLYAGDSSVLKGCIECDDVNLGMDNCVTCYNQQACRKCESGYTLTQAGLCQSCYSQSNCMKCDGKVCTQCSPGFYLTQDNTCLRCDDTNCLYCPYNTISQQSVCQTCQSGYYLHPPSLSCIACKRNIRGSNCVHCDYTISDSGNYRLLCQTCDNGYGLVLQDQTCVKCSLPNCQSCVYDSATGTPSCAKCVAGFFLETDKTCSSCSIQKCLTCERDGSVETEFKCSSCESSYFVNTTANLCQDCNSTIPGCFDCAFTSNQLTCNQCLSPYFYQKDGNCLSCSTATVDCLGCLINNGQILCTSCIEGTFLRNPLNCSKCLIANCATCSARDVGKSCSACKSGFYLAGSTNCGVCSDVILGCAACQLTSGQVQCLQCAKGRYLRTDEDGSTVCEKCSENCDECSNATYCLSCAGEYYIQISVDGGYCLNTYCDNVTNLVNETQKTCTACNFLYGNCSTCNKTECLTCIADNFLMLPSKQSCSICSGSLFTFVDSTSFCSYSPYIASLERLYSVTTGNTTLMVDCGVNQTVRVLLVYFNYLASQISEINFSTVYSTLELNNFGEYFDPADVFWTVFLAQDTDNFGQMTVMLDHLKNFGVNYKLQAWCQNFGNDDSPLNITSNYSSITWFQNDNNGSVIKLYLLLNSFPNSGDISLLAEIFTDRLQLKSLNRELITGVFDPVHLSGGVQLILFIERDYSIVLNDASANGIVTQITQSSFRNTVNSDLAKAGSSKFLASLDYELLDSVVKGQEPVFKSVDFIRILACDSYSANFSLKLINGNGFIYLGLANKSSLGDISWEELKEGKDPEGKPLDDFNVTYVRANQTASWNLTNLVAGKGYVLYFGGTTEDLFSRAIKTKTYRVAFRTKGIIQ